MGYLTKKRRSKKPRTKKSRVKKPHVKKSRVKKQPTKRRAKKRRTNKTKKMRGGTTPGSASKLLYSGMDKIKANDYVGAVRDLRQAIEQFKEMGHHASVRSANIFLKEAREASPAAAAADAALARSEAAAEKKRQDAADDPDARRGLLAEAAERRATVTDFT